MVLYVLSLILIGHFTVVFFHALGAKKQPVTISILFLMNKTLSDTDKDNQ